MRLVEILARELHEWPDGQLWASQDPDKEVRFDEDPIHDFYVSQLADDAGLRIGCGARVTREMWEAERARLDRAVEWDGYGLPPVHTACEHQGDDEDCNSWFPVFILAHATIGDRRVAVFQRVDDDMHISFSDAVFFRPIRTHEQVAAENREEGIMEMMRKSGERLSFRKICEALYDAGYRKQEND